MEQIVASIGSWFLAMILALWIIGQKSRKPNPRCEQIQVIQNKGRAMDCHIDAVNKQVPLMRMFSGFFCSHFGLFILDVSLG